MFPLKLERRTVFDMNTDFQTWTEEDVLQRIGQPESTTLEFKESKLLSSQNKLLKELSQDISAFANTEGGTIIIGIQEKRSRPRIALEIEGEIDPEQHPLIHLQQMLESSVQPQLQRLTCQSVSFSDGKAVYVISVPKGHTAHQARDGVYYTRSGFRTRIMPDHLVRLLMLKGSIPRATLSIDNCDIVEKHEQHEYRFDLLVENSGEVSIRDFLLAVSISVNDDMLQLWAPTMFVDNEEAIRNELKSVESMLEIGEDIDEYKKHEILHGPGIPFQSGEVLRCSYRRIMRLLYQIEGRTLFPQDKLIFPGGKWLIEGIPQDVALSDYQPRLTWTIYLDNAPPCTGELNLAAHFQQQQDLIEAFF